MRRLSAVLLILFCLAAISAAPPPDDLSKKFLGAWRRVSVGGGLPRLSSVFTQNRLVLRRCFSRLACQ